MAMHISRWARLVAVVATTVLVVAPNSRADTQIATGDQVYEQQDTRELVALVTDAAALVRARGADAFADFRAAGSRWRQGDTYVFVLDPQGNMLVHPDPAMEGRNQLGLKDVSGRPIIRGLIDAATALADKPDGWYHYQWPVPGGLLPRWKSSYVQVAAAPSGERFVVGSGVYNDRMERAFVVDTVKDAVGLVEKDGRAAFAALHDPTGRFIAKDAYVFVVDQDGVELVNPGFPSLEGRAMLDVKDTHGKRLIREMLDVVRANGSGWVDYMWPKPGESVSTVKSAYVSRARLDGSWVVVGCGVYLADAAKAPRAATAMTAAQLMTFVRGAAAELEDHGEGAYEDFRGEGSKWFTGDTYLFVWKMDGTREFHAAEPSLEGRNDRHLTDAIGRPYGEMFLEAASTPSGEGWVHYMYPEPGDIFPTWKSSFVKRVTFPSGEKHLVGAGIYNMQMDKAFIEDVVDRAALLVVDRGRDAFDSLRDKTGPFRFMDTYVFVDSPDGVEIVNPGQPSVEGTNMMNVRDAKGKLVLSDYIALAMKDGSGWVEYEWYRPGTNTPAHKQTFVKKVQSHGETFIVGSGLYIE